MTDSPTITPDAVVWADIVSRLKGIFPEIQIGDAVDTPPDEAFIAIKIMMQPSSTMGSLRLVMWDVLYAVSFFSSNSDDCILMKTKASANLLPRMSNGKELTGSVGELTNKKFWITKYVLYPRQIAGVETFNTQGGLRQAALLVFQSQISER